jgi:hypothetical protein
MSDGASTFNQNLATSGVSPPLRIRRLLLLTLKGSGCRVQGDLPYIARLSHGLLLLMLNLLLLSSSLRFKHIRGNTEILAAQNIVKIHVSHSLFFATSHAFLT